MKKLQVSDNEVQKALAALDEIETAVLGTAVKGSGDGDPPCKPWLCPQPLYGNPI